jgi:mitochondrial fission protein ELM1
VAEVLPHIWILSRGRKGDLDQMVALARAVGWPYEVKRLHFAGPEIPAFSRLLLRNRAEVLTPPWPDLVLCAEASPSVIARHIRRMSGGSTRAVCIGRPAGSAAAFDLVITTAQYRIPPAPNVVELSMPLTTDMGAPPRGLPAQGPIAVIVGGPAFPDRLDEAAALALTGDMLAYAARRKAVLAVHTSPRTPPPVAAVLGHAIKAPHQVYVFGQGPNRYRDVLAEASEIVVTSDSVSMVADALAAGKAVSIYRLPLSDSFKLRVGEWLHRKAFEAPDGGVTPIRWLFDMGLVEAAADRRRLFTRLVSEQRAVWFGEETVPPRGEAAASDLAMAVESLRRLLA